MSEADLSGEPDIEDEDSELNQAGGADDAKPPTGFLTKAKSFVSGMLTPSDPKLWQSVSGNSKKDLATGKDDKSKKDGKTKDDKRKDEK